MLAAGEGHKLRIGSGQHPLRQSLRIEPSPQQRTTIELVTRAERHGCDRAWGKALASQLASPSGESDSSRASGCRTGHGLRCAGGGSKGIRYTKGHHQ